MGPVTALLKPISNRRARLQRTLWMWPLAALGLLGICIGRYAQTTGDQAEAASYAAPESDVRRLAGNDLLFVGRIVSIGPPPRVWIGFVVVRQDVTYDVLRVLRGAVSGPQIVVGHVVCTGSPTGDKSANSLDLAAFAIGRTVIVGAVDDRVGREALGNDERLAFLPWSPRVERQVVAALKEREVR